MAEVKWHTEITTQTVYTLLTPTNWVEVGKALSIIRQHVKDAGRTEWDDLVTVEVGDDEIRFVLPVDETRS